ncbi:effector of transcription 2-like protein [Tanacetum coccineum]
MTKTTIAPELKRENCKRTKHDSLFSNWKILIGASDWEDYLLNKEGAERYRTQNIPNCSSCAGLYELGIVVSLSRTNGKSSSKLTSKSIIPVYLGQADNVRTRLQQYGRDGAHLENGLSNGEQLDRKVLGLFSDIFSYGFAIAFRWAPMESKKDAEKTETQLLKTFDYAWNREMNGERRPGDIHRKLDAASGTKRVPLLYKKQKDTNILFRIFKFGRSRPTLVSKDFDINNTDATVCGVALGHGSICIKPPVEGRKRCVDHKGMKVNAVVKPTLHTITEDTPHLTCGVTLEDSSICTRVPVVGKKRCEDHKGMRLNRRIQSGLNLEIGTFCDKEKSCEEHKGIEVDGKGSSSCAAITRNGSSCKRKPGKDSKFCWQHAATKTL